MTSNLFETWFEQIRLPNLNAHSKQTGKPCIIILPLLPYSPNLNPIEKTWATIKKWLGCHLGFDGVGGGLSMDDYLAKNDVKGKTIILSSDLSNGNDFKSIEQQLQRLNNKGFCIQSKYILFDFHALLNV